MSLSNRLFDQTAGLIQPISRVLRCLRLIFLVALSGASLSGYAYDRVSPAPWFSPLRTASYDGAGLNGPLQFNPPGMVFFDGGYYYGVILSGRGYGVPEAGLARAVEFGNSAFSAASYCRAAVVFESQGCKTYNNTTLNCSFQGTAADRGKYQPWDGTCNGSPSTFVVKSEMLITKNCGGTSNTTFDMASRECLCREGNVYVPEKNLCVPVRDRVVVKPCDTCHGNPVMAPIGAKSQSVEAGWQPWLPIRLTFNTMRHIAYDSGVDPFLQSDPHTFGEWTASFDRALYASKTVIDRKIVNVSRGDGLWTTFTQNITGGPLVPAEGNDQLTTNAQGYLYRDFQARLLEQYDAAGKLLQIWRADGATLSVTRSTGADYPAIPEVGKPKTLTDQFGRRWRLEYGGNDGAARASAIWDPGFGRVAVTYTAADQVKTLLWNDGTSREFLYEHALPWAMTGYMDENGVRGGTYSYDSAGRSTGTMRGGGADAYTFSWTTPSHWQVIQRMDEWGNAAWRDHTLIPATDVRVTLPNGQTELVSSSSSFGSVKWTSKTQAAGAGSPAATAQRVLDANQNVTQSDDYNGNRSCMRYEATRNVETARIEGLTTASTCDAAWTAIPATARMTSTQWHPNWPLAMKTAEPGRITTTIYNGQPDPTNSNAVANCAPDAALLPDGSMIAVVCKRVEQATTDTTGALGFNAVAQGGVPARSWSWIYNALGQVLTEKDPLGKTTVTNEYYADTIADDEVASIAGHTIGDLKSTINAVGHVTSFPRYNAYGLPLELIDSNGISTTYRYDARQRLSKTTTGDETTSYTYWPTGKLKQVTQPDGGAVFYSYDDAQRLVAVSDNLGNQVEYTLDNTGNRTLDVVKDPGGVLQRSLTRVFDALNRTQKTTGGE